MSQYETLYLPKDIANIFSYYGGVEKCVNRILDMSSQGLFDMTDKPKIRNRTKCRRYNILITNDDYLELRKIYPITSPRLSLRRLCEWFVDNEMYIDWELDECDKTDDKLLPCLADTCKQLERLLMLSKPVWKNKILTMMSLLKEVVDCEERERANKTNN